MRLKQRIELHDSGKKLEAILESIKWEEQSKEAIPAKAVNSGDSARCLKIFDRRILVRVDAAHGHD